MSNIAAILILLIKVYKYNDQEVYVESSSFYNEVQLKFVIDNKLSCTLYSFW